MIFSQCSDKQTDEMKPEKRKGQFSVRSKRKNANNGRKMALPLIKVREIIPLPSLGVKLRAFSWYTNLSYLIFSSHVLKSYQIFFTNSYFWNKPGSAKVSQHFLFTCTAQFLESSPPLSFNNRGCSAVVARSLCMWKAPGSIPGISIGILFSFKL